MSSSDFADIPITIPARMVNEFVYCPRFFYFGFVAAERGENERTAEGKWGHRRVDAGDATGPSSSGSARVCRSFELSSEKLALSAKVDLVTITGNAAVPTDYKDAVKPKAGPEVAAPEVAQLVVAGMLLRDAGYACEYGEIYYIRSNEHVRVCFTEEVFAEVDKSVQALRGAAQCDTPPPPLEDSPKCPACIFVGICLPDEQAMFRRQREKPPRRLIPPDSPAAPMYVVTPGARVGRDGDRIVVKQHGEHIGDRRLLDLSSLIVYGNVSISTQLVRELMSREIPIAYFTSGGWFSGITQGLPSKNIEIRRRQAEPRSERDLAIARRMIEAKILNARALLRRNAAVRDDFTFRELKRLAHFAAQAESQATLLGLEGAAARLYFSRFGTMLKRDSEAFDFNLRNRRPPKDRVNAVMSFVYGLLVRDLTAIALIVGLDPYLGVLHAPRFGRPAMALDLAEEFRPLIADSVVLAVVNNREVGDSSLTETPLGVALNNEGRKSVLRAYERRVLAEFLHPSFGYRVTYRRAMEIQARLVAAVMLGEFDVYQGVVTR